MSLKKFILIFRRIDFLIIHQCTGNPEELATKLHISKRQLFNYIRDLKELGYNIKYSHTRNSYYYSEDNSKIHTYSP